MKGHKEVLERNRESFGPFLKEESQDVENWEIMTFFRVYKTASVESKGEDTGNSEFKERKGKLKKATRFLRKLFEFLVVLLLEFLGQVVVVR